MKDADDYQVYIERHFWRIEGLAEAVGEMPASVEQLIEAGCAPSASYVRGADGWWSALEREAVPRPDGLAWYSRGSAWTLRRAILARRDGASAAEAAITVAREFTEDFVAALASLPGADIAFPDCFRNGTVDQEAAHRAATEEWVAWLDGGYGNCLKVFNGEICVAKESLAASIKAALAAGSYAPARLLSDCGRLAALILPFAPWQRAECTPGHTIDPLLAELRLGSELPYS